jgi:uncharacterized protein
MTPDAEHHQGGKESLRASRQALYEALCKAIAIRQHGSAKMDASSTKRCPQCAEDVKAEAKVCRFCGFDFGAADRVRVEREQAAERYRVERERKQSQPAWKKALRSLEQGWQKIEEMERQNKGSNSASCCGCSCGSLCVIAGIPVLLVLFPLTLGAAVRSAPDSAPCALWNPRAGFASRFAIRLIETYRQYLSGRLPVRCRFEPSCSAYGLRAYRSHRFMTATRMTVWRILRCNPLNRRSTFERS